MLRPFLMSEKFQNDVVNDGNTLLNEYITPVANAFADATFYDKEFNIVNLKSRQVVCEATAETREHANGDHDPKSRSNFSKEDKKFLADFSFASLGSSIVHHNTDFVESNSIPDDFRNLTVP